MKREIFKRSFTLFVLALFIFSFLSSVVSAQNSGISWDNFKSDFSRFSSFTSSTFDKPLIIQILLYFLVFLVMSSIVSFIPLFSQNMFVRFLVSVSVTILSMILIPAEFLLLVVNPYTALGMTIITVLPFIFMFVFVRTVVRNRFFKNLLWGVFALCFVLLGLMVFFNDSLTDAQKWPSYIYFGFSILAVFAMLFSEWLEDRIFRGVVKAAGQDAKQYLVARKLQMEFDRERAESELGLKTDALKDRRAFK